MAPTVSYKDRKFSSV